MRIKESYYHIIGAPAGITDLPIGVLDNDAVNVSQLNNAIEGIGGSYIFADPSTPQITNINLDGNIQVISDVDRYTILKNTGLDFGLIGGINWNTSGIINYNATGYHTFNVDGTEAYKIRDFGIVRSSDNKLALFEGDLDGYFIKASPSIPQVADINLDGNINFTGGTVGSATSGYLTFLSGGNSVTGYSGLSFQALGNPSTVELRWQPQDFGRGLHIYDPNNPNNTNTGNNDWFRIVTTDDLVNLSPNTLKLLSTPTTATSGYHTIVRDDVTGEFKQITSSGGGVGTVTSVGATVPTGFSISGSPVTSSGTLAISFTSGYSLPTNTKQGQWDTAFGWGNHASAGYQLVSNLQTNLSSSSTKYPSVDAVNTGLATKANLLNGNNFTGVQKTDQYWSTSVPTTGTQVVSKLGLSLNFGASRAVGTLNLNTTSIDGVTAITTGVLQAPAAQTSNWIWTLPDKTGTLATLSDITGITIGTANGLSLAGQALSLGLASSGVTGALSGTDWNTFNAKQGALILTTTGTSGSASLIGNTLNIPNYATGGGGGGSAALRVPVVLASNGTLITIDWSLYSATFGSAATDLSLIEDSPTGEKQVFTNWYSDDNGAHYKFDVAPEVGSRNFVVVISGGSSILSGTVTSVTSANGDISVANSTTTPVLTLNSGTGANQIVKRNGSGLIADVQTGQTIGANTSGNAATATNSTQWNGVPNLNTPLASPSLFMTGSGGGSWQYSTLAQVKNTLAVTLQDATVAGATSSVGRISITDGTQGLLIGAYTTPSTARGAIYASTVTPGTSNYALVTNGAGTILNATSISVISINNTAKLAVTDTDATFSVPIIGSSFSGTSGSFSGNVNALQVGAGVLYIGSIGSYTGRLVDGGSYLSLDTYNGSSFAKELRLQGSSVTVTTAPVNPNDVVRLQDIPVTASGTYTPTVTDISGTSSITAYPCQWLRVGSVVTLSGKIRFRMLTPNSSGSVSISLPSGQNSNFTLITDANGSGITMINGFSGAAIYAVASSNTLQLYAAPTASTVAQEYSFTCQYIIK